MATFAIYLRSGDVKEMVADYYVNDSNFFNFYEQPQHDNETPLKFSIAISEVSTVEKR